MRKIQKTEEGIKVEMIEDDNKEVNIRLSYHIDKFISLGKEIKISPKSFASLNKKGLKIEYFTETVSVTIGIGNDHTAELTMMKSAWDALQAGEKVDITTLKGFYKKFGKNDGDEQNKNIL